ncbi:MAG TPA: signal peptide peptidase SppA [Deinococcales bacterium]|nr:signal peptide peptidase SppA [Deinococcales bacterium]
MPHSSKKKAAPAGSVIHAALTLFLNGFTRLQNALARAMPGERPTWFVLELSGPYPARRVRRKRFAPEALMGQELPESLEELERKITALCGASWLEGVVVRFGALQVGWTGAWALRRQLELLREAGKKLTVIATELGDVTYWLASVADEIIVPESAELNVTGPALSTAYFADFLGRFGVSMEKIGIREYKTAMDNLARSSMSEYEREQLGALLDSFQREFTAGVAAGRGVTPGEVTGWVDAAVSAAEPAQAAGMIDRVAYEDEVLDVRHKQFGEGARFLLRPLRRYRRERIALVTLEGAIVTGKSQKSPVPLPLVGSTMAGSATLVAALRAAGKDPRTAAVVFHVDSGGGSALASDLIWREVKLLAERMPVVAVMGGAAASGGYYVLTHATKVLAAPTTITGSIGVMSGHFVLQEFNERYGITTETLKRGRFADLGTSDRPYTPEERVHVERYMEEVYGRFTGRVADGRDLEPERVAEIARGRIWSGADALELGLIDDYDDVATAVRAAAQLAGLPADTPVRNVVPPPGYVLPVGADNPEAALATLLPLARERVLLMNPLGVAVRT